MDEGVIEAEKELRGIKLKLRSVYVSPASYFKRLNLALGTNFMVMLASAYIGCKGALDTLMLRSMLPYYKMMGLDIVAYQTASTVARIPWAIKGFVGALSDGFPLFGYHKRPYVLISVLVGILGPIGLILLSEKAASQSIWVAPVLFFATNFECSTVDLLCEGKYSELMKKSSESGPSIVTFVWTSIMFGKLVATAIIGPILDRVGVKTIFFIALPLALQVSIPTLLGFLTEERLPVGQRNKPQWNKFRKEKHYFVVSLLVSGSALGLVLVGLFLSPTAQFIYVVASATLLCAVSIIWLPRLIACCNLYMFIDQLLKPDIGGAIDYWFVADEECLPGGPAFSYTYYTTWTGMVGIAASIVGITLFQVYLSKFSFRKAFWVTTIVKIAASLVDLCIVKRWNIAAGIPDKVFFMLGDAIILDVVSVMNFMPGVVLIARLCPDSMESTVYAILAAFSNFGMSISKSIGTFAIDKAGIKAVTPCNFDKLSLLLIICHFLIPILSIPLTFILIPNVPMSGTFNQAKAEASISLNLYERCRIEIRKQRELQDINSVKEKNEPCDTSREEASDETDLTSLGEEEYKNPESTNLSDQMSDIV